MVTVKTKGKAAIYARLSSDRDGDAVSVPLQIDECRKEAERRGYAVPDSLVFQDRNLSASKVGTVRPAYNALVDALKRGAVDTVFVRETSRLYRRPDDLEELVGLVEGKGVRIIPLFSGEIDFDKGLLEARIRAAVDAEEVKKLSQRVRMAKARRREEGRHNGGGRRPYGYRRVAGGFEIVPEEAAIIREAVDRILGGEPVSRITSDWNDHGLTSGDGYRWRPTHLRRILTGRNGKTETGGTTLRGAPLIVGGHGWEPIVSPDEAALVTAKLAAAKPHRLKNAQALNAHPGARRYALSGLLVCQLCGARSAATVSRRSPTPRAPRARRCPTLATATSAAAARHGSERLWSNHGRTGPTFHKRGVGPPWKTMHVKAWQVWALAGLAAGIIGVLVLSWVTRQLVEATNQLDGILLKDRERVKWVGRAGWALIAVGFGAQAVSVILAG